MPTQLRVLPVIIKDPKVYSFGTFSRLVVPAGCRLDGGCRSCGSGWEVLKNLCCWVGVHLVLSARVQQSDVGS